MCFNQVCLVRGTGISPTRQHCFLNFFQTWFPLHSVSGFAFTWRPGCRIAAPVKVLCSLRWPQPWEQTERLQGCTGSAQAVSPGEL